MGVIMLAGSSALAGTAVLKEGGKAQAVVSKVAATRAQKVVRFIFVVLV
jgi:hypothetical protein